MIEEIVRRAIERLFRGGNSRYDVETNLEEAIVNSDDFIEAVMARVDSMYADVIDSVVRDIDEGDYDEVIQEEVF